ncbi:App1 family protein [Christiangramia fulva]|nr:phosphatase domain-containing protein [Christiangramia fulva]
MSKQLQQIKENLRSALDSVEREISLKKYQFKDRFSLLEPITIMPFFGFGNDHYVYVKGRVLEKEKIKRKEQDISNFEHLKNTAKRYETDEIPGIKIRASFAEKQLEIKTDSDGFFLFEFEFDKPIDYQKHGNKVKLRLLETKTDEDEMEASAKIFVPDENAEFGVISDVDDTVLISHMTDFFAKIKLMLLNDAKERSPFPGISALLTALSKGRDDKGRNALFYVSGSEWNLYDLLINFFKYQDIPLGPLSLKDKGIKADLDKFTVAHQEYKARKIRHILKTYPDLDFICIGDSGQHDPETYCKILEEFPGRIKAIYIRDVTPAKRDKEVKKIAEKVKEMGAEMLLIEDTLEAAKHAAKMKWINEHHLEKVKKQSETDRN